MRAAARASSGHGRLGSGQELWGLGSAVKGLFNFIESPFFEISACAWHSVVNERKEERRDGISPWKPT